MSRYIIEHPTKGVLMSQDYDPIDGEPSTGYKSVWSWSKPRSEALVFNGIASAKMARRRVAEAVVGRVEIRRWGDWELVR